MVVSNSDGSSDPPRQGMFKFSLVSGIIYIDDVIITILLSLANQKAGNHSIYILVDNLVQFIV